MARPTPLLPPMTTTFLPFKRFVLIASFIPYSFFYMRDRTVLFSTREYTIQFCLVSRGAACCSFLNALAEFSEADHPAHRCAVEHERALRWRLAQLSQQAGARDPEELADQLLLVSNGALASASIFGEASPAVQLKTIAAHLIDLQL